MQRTRLKEWAATAKSGFTLIEMLIVIVILGILAMIVIPQISTSTDDAKLATLRTNLSAMRGAVELYNAQHGGLYPGTGATAAKFVQQLTQYTDATGTVSDVKSDIYKFGPYVKGTTLPKNPFTDTTDVTLDIAETSITKKESDGGTAWKFYTITGVFMANDGSHDGE